MSDRRHPLELLQEMQQLGRQAAPGLPEQVQTTPLWSGLGFKVDDLHLVTPLDHVSEVLPCPAYTPVPGTKRWLKGIANVRGNLLTILDMAEYFGKPTVRMDDRARLMVMNVHGLHAALIVNEVLGLRHFDEEKEKQDVSVMDNAVSMHLRGAFLREDIIWGVFDMHSLAESPTFRHVSTS